MQSRAVTGILTVYKMGLIGSTVCGAQEGTPTHVLCEREAFATLRRAYPSYFLLHPEDVRNLSLGSNLESY